MNWNDLRLRLRALAFRDRTEHELDEELDFHIEMQTRKNLAAGMSESDARREACIRFGRAGEVKEECRDARRVNLIETAWQDIRYAIRGFRRSPTFVLTVVATIALGLGLNTALFTIFNAYVLRPVAVRNPYSLYEFRWMNRTGVGHLFTWSEYQEFRKQDPAFSQVFAYRNIQDRVDGRNVFIQLVTGDYFRTLGVNAALGRTLLPEDSSVPGREPIAVISYSAWRDRFASDPAIVGRKVLIHGHPIEIAGVMREGFMGLEAVPADFWAPVTAAVLLEDGPDIFGPEHPGALRILGRLKTGISVQEGQAGLTLWAQRITAGRPDSDKPVGAILRSRATTIPLTRTALLTFSPIVISFGLVLLIACANVANMMLARAMSRQREIGVRLSLGAARGRLIRQLLTESVLLALPAAAAGFAVSQFAIEYGGRLMFATLPSEFAEFIRLAPLPPDLRVFGFMLVAAVGSALLFGLAPAMQATRANVMQAARGDFTNDIRPTRLRNFLVIAQITVCVLLLICAGVLLRGARRMQNLDPGLRTQNIVEIEIQEKSRARVLARLAAEPLVESVASAANTPLDGAFPRIQAGAADNTVLVQASYNHVSPEYFPIFEIPILRGRNFTAEEANSGAPVAIVSQGAAQQLWPNRDAVGQSMRLAPEQGEASGVRRYPAVRVIGIARDAISGWIGNGLDKSCVYFPANPLASGNLIVRVHGDAGTARRKLDADLSAIDPAAVQQIHKMQEFLAIGTYPFRVAHWISSLVGALALLLTLSGIYGVLSYVVSQRTKEIGIRMAMGATTRAVIGLVLKQSMRLAVMGIACGGVLALGVSRIFASRLVMMDTFDGWAYCAGVLVVLSACAGAAYLPSRRAASIDPVSTLRYD
jgi:predicted permease